MLRRLAAVSSALTALFVSLSVSRADDSLDLTSIPKVMCPLPRSPLLPAVKAMPGLEGDLSIACISDADGNGLDDGVEALIASCVVPVFKFDSDEGARRLAEPCPTSNDPTNMCPAEPRVLWNATRETLSVFPTSGWPPAPLYSMLLRFRFAFLFGRDGGFVDSGFDSHPGDTERGTIEVRVVRVAGRWFAYAERYNGKQPGMTGTYFRAAYEPDKSDRLLTGSFPPKYAPGDPARMEGTHPVLYPSASKHHLYLDPGEHVYPNDGPREFWQDDRARGNSESFLPAALFHVPLLEFERGGIRSNTVVDAKGNWVNACSFASAPDNPAAWTTAFGLQKPSLDNLGYPYDDLRAWDCFHGTQEFRPKECYAWDCSVTGDCVHVTPVAGVLDTAGLVPDLDGDGHPEVSGWFKRGGTWQLLHRVDTCPWTKNDILSPLDDPDDDGLGLACDPDPLFRNTYRGAFGLNDTTFAPGLPPWLDYRKSWVSLKPWTRGGFADLDLDGLVDGEDRCPFATAGTAGTALSGDLASANQWGEDLNWEPGAPTTPTRELGVFHRGDLCDPYPTAVPTLVEKPRAPGGGGGLCSGKPFLVGASEVTLRQSVTLGKSQNDRTSDAGLVQRADLYRCACRDLSGNKLYGSSCLDDPESDCRRVGVSPAPTASLRGWLPLLRAGCVKGPDGYCRYPRALWSMPRTTQSIDLRWDWLAEVNAFGPESTPPHFGSLDFERTAGFVQSQFDFITWTQLRMDRAPWFPKVVIDEPEHLDPDLAKDLADNLKRRRLRAGFSDSFALSEPHPLTVTGCPGIGWIIAHWEDWLDMPISDPPIDLFDRLKAGGVRVLARTEGLGLSERSILRPLQGGGSRVALTPNSTASWIETSQGVAGLLRPMPATVGAPAEPDILWVEIGPQAARWARLATLSAGGAQPNGGFPTTLEYDVVASGTFDESLGSGTFIVRDASSEYAALVDPQAGRVWGFDPGTNVWVRSTAAVDLTARRGAAFTLYHGLLVVAGGGADNGSPRTDIDVLDVFGAGQRTVQAGLPPRRNARIAVSDDRKGFLYAGGSDDLGVIHDDVWAVPFVANAVPGGAKLLRAGTTSASTFDTAKAAVSGTIDGGVLRSWTLDPSFGSGVHDRRRTIDGWVDTDVAGNASAEACDAPRQVVPSCPLGTSWWSVPGKRACGGTTCAGAPGSLIRALSLPVATPAPFASDGAALAGDALWIGQSSRLERRSVALGVAGPTIRVAEMAHVHGVIRDVAATSTEAVVATAAGVAHVFVRGCSTGNLARTAHLTAIPADAELPHRTSPPIPV